ncbi:alpha/beta fold hydrolase [Streptantibioticus silvisoli]|jgi:pimeloyl-ACP methyl ester carboxylesterase|uniref:Alpha/beta hydrolase n=1 Tax=Streptantibioticus silvisoli TaxID=2705255 RepID=A0ABT6VS90_9ACTN|nr:alpha/beta hydrolase [Streptantibioticus silvisoli]MDI5961342.1 alpha/beta hydrolase [Streptantibioticus silvisoli]
MITTVDGVPVHYTTHGTGPGLLLVHSAGADNATTFGQLQDRFTDRYTVIAPDFSGSGGTPLPDEPLTVDLLAGQVAAVAREVTDQPFDVVGFSMGSIVAAALAAAHPERVRRLVLISCWNRGDDPRQQRLLALWHRLADLDPQAYARFTALSVFSGPFLAQAGHEAMDEIVALITLGTGVRAQMDLATRMDISDRLEHITAPTLAIGAAQDHWVPVSHARETAQRIKGCYYEEVDSGHMSVFERPAEVAELVAAFLDA